MRSRRNDDILRSRWTGLLQNDILRSRWAGLLQNDMLRSRWTGLLQNDILRSRWTGLLQSDTLRSRWSGLLQTRTDYEADRQVCFKQTVGYFTPTLICSRFKKNIQNSSGAMLATVKHSVTSTATNWLYTFSCIHSPTSACTFPMFALSLNGQQSTSCHWNGPTINKLSLKWALNQQAVTEMGPQSTSCHWNGPTINKLSLK